MRQLPIWANKYVGIPYQTKGITLEGLDCLGLMKLIYQQEFNIRLPDYPHIDTDVDMKGASEKIIMGKEDWVKIEQPEAGCVVLLKICGYPVHLGIALTETSMIHSLKGHNSVIETFTGNKWKRRLEGYYKWQSM